MSTAGELIQQHPANVVANPGYKTTSDKAWAHDYNPIKTTIVHTIIRNGITDANFEDAFMGMENDDELRFRQPAVRTNQRHWRLETEADCENWFNTEITKVVLSAWHDYPPLMQTSHTKPLSEENISENVDCTFSVKVAPLPGVDKEVYRKSLEVTQANTSALRYFALTVLDWYFCNSERIELMTSRATRARLTAG
ncbi:hypothetical protein FVEG_11054 [Fusarium verticillioides 7600]|uniref:Uncharacterized protein n=1 Tax=Gibberella moniliformis (strain M3125 / FGSC 7600) TaxID=334819 RepID=W7MMG3_GIBM7|nr:hypothetical protein FVEG_11054 [Fusarium verticillioides 7600]EWG52271.1 hypothetical protein FVEG_11054 [Fusarium verticillioides 7600]